MDHEELEEEEEEEEEKKTKKKKKLGSKKHPRLQRSFLHFSKAFKKLHAAGHARPSVANDGPSPSSRSSNPAGASSSLLSACMHPRTLSFSSSGGGRQRHVAVHHRGDEDEDDDDSLAVNFRSLRIESTAAVGSSSSAQAQEDCGRGSESEGEDGGGANGNGKAAVGGGVAVVTFSVAPYEDFRRSMREMVDARRGVLAAGATVDWDLMEELLFCYLQLNDRAVHKDILRAFTDTVAALRRRRRGKPRKSSRRTRARAGPLQATGDGVVQDQPAGSS